MKATKITLIFYFFVAGLAILANILNNETLLLLAKPLVVPSIYFYYFINSKKINILFTIAIFWSFIGESIGLMNFENEIFLIIVPFFISNILILFLVIKDKDRFRFKAINVLSMVIILFFLIFTWCSIVELFSSGESNILLLQIAIYGLSLLVLALFTGYKIISRINYSNISLTIYVTCILISNVFYIIYSYQYAIVALDIIHFSTQMISYYFLVLFMLNRDKNNDSRKLLVTLN